MTTFAVQRLHSPLEWNGSGTRRLKESKFSDSEKSIYACNTCVMLVKKSTVTFFWWNIKFYSLQNIRCCLFQEMKKGHILRILSVFQFALVFLFLLRSSENEVLKCSSECDKTAITLRSMFENFGYDDASFKKESFFFWYDDVTGMSRPMAWSHGTRIETHHDQIKRNLTHHWQNMQ